MKKPPHHEATFRCLSGRCGSLVRAHRATPHGVARPNNLSAFLLLVAATSRDTYPSRSHAVTVKPDKAHHVASRLDAQTPAQFQIVKDIRSPLPDCHSRNARPRSRGYARLAWVKPHGPVTPYRLGTTRWLSPATLTAPRQIAAGATGAARATGGVGGNHGASPCPYLTHRSHTKVKF